MKKSLDPIMSKSMTRQFVLHAALALWILAIAAEKLSAGGGQFVLTIVDKDTGRPVACRMHLIGPKKKPVRPEKVPFWNDHFAVPGKILLRLPKGEYGFVLERGPEYLDQSGHFTIEHFADDAKQIEMRRFIDMAADGWWSGDLDVRRPAADIELLMQADDLHLAELITWQNGRTAWKKTPPPKRPTLSFDNNRCCGLLGAAWTRPGGELLLLRLSELPALPTEMSEIPPTVPLLLGLREKTDFWVDLQKAYAWDLPMLVAAGQIDSIQVADANLCRERVVSDEIGGRPRDRVRFPDPWGEALWSQYVYFQLLECGLRIPPSAGSGSGVAPNPVGHNRVYVYLDGEFSYQKWYEGLRAGRVFITNGPLLKPSVEGKFPGHMFQAERGEKLELEIALTLSTRQPISYLEIIKDGHVERSISLAEYAKRKGRLPKISFDRSGWFLIRAVTDLPKTYRFAMTGPYYVEIGGERRISKSAAQFFVEWVFQRARDIRVEDPKPKKAVLEWHRQARDYWKSVLERANAE